MVLCLDWKKGERPLWDCSPSTPKAPREGSGGPTPVMPSSRGSLWTSVLCSASHPSPNKFPQPRARLKSCWVQG